jgi:hypothetical protein
MKKTFNLAVFAILLLTGPAHALSFTDNGDGTVSDDITGLMWQQEDDNTTRNWFDALSYCEGLTLAGHGDWRLPNVKALESIVDDTQTSPSIDSGYFPNTNPDFYWSSTTSAVQTTYAWSVGFTGNGATNEGFKGTTFRVVRCVR